MNTYMKIVLFLLSLWASAASQVKWYDYIAVYHLHSADGKRFNNFRYFELEPADHWKYIDPTRCSAHWFPTDSLYTDSVAVANMTEFFLENDSLHFRTTQCFNEQYEFFGRFRMPSTQFPNHLGEPVLDGILLFYRRGVLKQQLRVVFIYELSGD